MQIIFRATTATTAAVGAALTTGNAQVLPSWAPPIEYIGTTYPWVAFVLTGGNTTIPNTYAKTPKVARVRAYGRKATLHGGAECIALNREIFGPDGKFGTAELIILAYRAVGELVRP